MRQSLAHINLFAFCFGDGVCDEFILCANLHKEYYRVDMVLLSVFLDIQIGNAKCVFLNEFAAGLNDVAH